MNLPALRRFLPRARHAAGLAGEVGIRLMDDASMRRLNRRFRRHNRPTDVLSFPSDPWPLAPDPSAYAGDLAISLDTAARHARRCRHALESELRILILHGLLHLSGMDHETDAGEMYLRERQLRRRFRLPLGLIERTHGRNRSMENSGH